jgi:hypothetical protein
VPGHIGHVSEPTIVGLHEVHQIATHVADRAPDLGHEHAVNVASDGDLSLEAQVAGGRHVDEAEKGAVAEDDGGDAAHAIDEKSAVRRGRQHRKQRGTKAMETACTAVSATRRARLW